MRQAAVWYEHLAKHLDEAVDDVKASGALPEVARNFERAAVEARDLAKALRGAADPPN